MFRRNSMKQLRYPAIPQSLTKSRDGLMLTAGQGSGNAECVMRQQMAMRIYDIGGKRVNEVKLTVFSDYAVRSHPSCRKKSRRKSGLSVPKESDIDM